MATIGFLTSSMPDEKRVAILPKSLSKVSRPCQLFFEKHYANGLGVEDSEYKKAGANIISRAEFRFMDIICAPKRWASDRDVFRENHVLWSWTYAAQTKWLASVAVEKSMTLIAFEYMYDGSGNYVFPENRNMTGKAGILQSIVYAGMPPEKLTGVAVIGRGCVAKGAFEMLDRLGVKYRIFHKGNVRDFFDSLNEWNVIVNCIKWDSPGNYFMTKDHLSSLKRGALIIDISTEGIQGSKPQPVYKPVYEYKNVKIYNNDHIPTLWAGYASETIGEALVPFINDLTEGKENPILEKATVIKLGEIVDQRILETLNGRANATGTYS
jgi:N5-(carboxyethyl)ornithine synthase